MKKDQWKGKISTHEFQGRHFITLDMPRKPDEAGMFFIFEWLLRPWVDKNVIIDIREEDSEDAIAEERIPSPIEPLSIQVEWANKFRKIGVV